MRLLAILLLTTAAFADEGEALKAFANARKDPVSDAGRGRMAHAIDRLETEGGAASLAAIGNFIRDSFQRSAKILTELRTIKRQGAEAFQLTNKLTRELEQLEHRKQAGAKGLEPEIEKRATLARRAQAEFEQVKLRTSAIGRLYERHEQLRLRCADVCVKILARTPKGETVKAVDALRGELDPASEEQTLLLVGILRRSGKAEASATLLEIFSYPKSTPPVRVEAAIGSIAIRGRSASGSCTRFRALRRSASRPSTMRRRGSRPRKTKARTKRPGCSPRWIWKRGKGKNRGGTRRPGRC
ncbi:MAG: hypothetical protein ACYTHK_04645 [Planctomycetota bacterium]